MRKREREEGHERNETREKNIRSSEKKFKSIQTDRKRGIKKMKEIKRKAERET